MNLEVCNHWIAGFLIWKEANEKFVSDIRLQSKAVVHPKGRICQMPSFGRILSNEINEDVDDG